MVGEMSQFEDRIVQKKRDERTKRKEVLFEKIQGHKMASMTFATAYFLFNFFHEKESTDEDIMAATSIIEGHITDIREFWKNFPFKS